MKRRQPKRPYPRMARVNELLREVVAEELQDIDDDRLRDVSITDVTCDADLANAVVRYDALDGAESDDEVLEALEELRPRLQRAINAQTQLKGTPKLTFEPDLVVRSAARIDAVLRGLHDHDPGADEESDGSAGVGAEPPA
ncbi:MAG: 30S ribosome-binding factor RbfA [Acidimicrobiales bacterium]|nr:30S ribosome-binding factor RbfA [Acidimicrobiales bacterium]